MLISVPIFYIFFLFYGCVREQGMRETCGTVRGLRGVRVSPPGLCSESRETPAEESASTRLGT